MTGPPQKKFKKLNYAIWNALSLVLLFPPSMEAGILSALLSVLLLLLLPRLRSSLIFSSSLHHAINMSCVRARLSMSVFVCVCDLNSSKLLCCSGRDQPLCLVTLLFPCCLIPVGGQSHSGSPSLDAS